MSTPISKIDLFKLETTFGDGYVVNSTFEWDMSQKHTRLSTWWEQRLLGSGAFGSVWLEKNEQGGQLRAVKRLNPRATMNLAFSHELLALITLADVCSALAEVSNPGGCWHSIN